jgi:outer membrane protein OmpA-like peptidoglycan-associated protein
LYGEADEDETGRKKMKMSILRDCRGSRVGCDWFGFARDTRATTEEACCSHAPVARAHGRGYTFAFLCFICLGLAGLFLLVANPAAGLTDEKYKAMDALVQAHLADEFTTQDVIRLIELKVESESLVKEIAYRVSKNVDVTFPVSDADLDRIKRAGASNDLIEALRSPISAVRFAREHRPVLPRPVQFTSEEGGYSLDYPDQPEKKDWANAHGSLYIAVLANVVYMSGYSVYDQDVDGDRELEANTTSFAKEMGVKVTEKKPTRFVRARGDELPALECTVESDKALGRCLSVVDGRRFYIVGGFSVKPQNGEAGIDRFLKSFKLASSAASAPSAIASATESPTTSPTPERSLVSLSAGAMIVNKAQESDEQWAAIWLLDEKPANGWCTPKGATTNQVIVIALPELTTLKTVTFDTGSIDRSGRGAKDVLVEVSKDNENGGFEKIAEVSLQDQADNQTFPVSAEIPGRWVRLTVKNNHGSPDFTELMDFRATGTQLTHTSLPDISGTYSTNYQRFHIRQEGTSVTGCYEYRQGLLEGGIDGRVTSVTWKQPNIKGPAIIVFTSDGKHMSGIWWVEGNESNRGLWSGVKESSQVGSCSHWTGGIENQLIQDLETSGRARVYGINFDTDSERIKEESKPTLDKMVAMLKAKTEWKMSIEGHTDSTSTPQHNQELSERRAASVKNYLTTAGIDGSRLTTVGYGQSRPVADNGSPIGRSQNRRVELTKQ